ncbi:zf-C3HC4_3 domain-containing protein [Cephalotus follicularis]|uniref:Zf-C3HC4_3 domain-containing protein n=1 Tax=Cephalotus follicularis TaxID=3775 RepID=A0A1Q3AMF6_CEPFO|nr:zf-C3HC4_3 domain-containing protein [Cephalotus follicularis]
MAVQAQLYPENLGLPLPLCGLQDWLVINPVSVASFEPASCFTLFQDLHQHQQQDPLFIQQQQQQQQSPQNLVNIVCNSGASSSSSSFNNLLSMALSRSFDALLEMQRQETDYILQLQNERLRSALQEQRKQHLTILLHNLESKASCLMRQKEEELARATKRTMELEACLRKAKMESESWQKVARENGAMVISLSNTLEQARERLVLVSNRAEDSESLYCGSSSCDKEVKQERQEIDCKHCKSRSSCVLFLPCRHLCSCKSCDTFLGSCPVCKSIKKASMEVFWV